MADTGTRHDPNSEADTVDLAAAGSLPMRIAGAACIRTPESPTVAEALDGEQGRGAGDP